MVHNLDVTSSSYEWIKIIKKLSKNHTVYTLDLLGCGQSDKPALTYTNYLYVQLISDFITDIICDKTSVITSADACSFVVMANHIHPSLFHKIIMINPTGTTNQKLETLTSNLLKKRILFTPLIGTTLYNFFTQEKNIKKKFYQDYIYNKKIDYTRYIDIYYQSAHNKYSNGRYLYASILCGYTNVDLSIGLKDKDNLYIIESTSNKNFVLSTDSYVQINHNIEVTYISNAKQLPQLEVPDQLLKIIKADLT